MDLLTFILSLIIQQIYSIDIENFYETVNLTTHVKISSLLKAW